MAHAEAGPAWIEKGNSVSRRAVADGLRDLKAGVKAMNKAIGTLEALKNAKSPKVSK